MKEQKKRTMTRRHKADTRTFEELDYADQARSINAQIRVLEKAITANIRRAKKEKRPSPAEKRIEQVERLVQRLKAKYL